MEKLRVGDPLDESTDIGPLATRANSERCGRAGAGERRGWCKDPHWRSQVQSDGDLARGNFYEPTVLADIPKDTPAYRDEIFGPVASLFRVRNIDEAIELANATTFGLGAAAWTN